MPDRPPARDPRKCTADRPCDEGEGDCNKYEDCAEDLVCGSNNCQGRQYGRGDDCCRRRKLSVSYGYTQPDLDLAGAVDCLQGISYQQKAELVEVMEDSLLEIGHCEELFNTLIPSKKFVQKTYQSSLYGEDFQISNCLMDTVESATILWPNRPDLGCLREDLRDQFQQIAEEHGLSPYVPAVCDEDERYRSIEGICNNLEYPHYGAANTAYPRFMDYAYEGGDEYLPRGGRDPSRLPSPRDISRTVHAATREGNSSVTMMLFQFGQFLDHDLTLTSQPEFDCCHPDIRAVEKRKRKKLRRCFNINIKCDCDFYVERQATCHPFSRSYRNSDGDQTNGLTSFIDASNVYGSDRITASKLRTMRDGYLLDHEMGNALPSMEHAGIQAVYPFEPEDLVAGDIRAIQHPGIASIQSLFLNEHNRIARNLKSRLASHNFFSYMSSAEQDEFLYQETRRIVGALVQNIVFTEFLPEVLGRESMNYHDLTLESYSKYDPRENAAVRSEFATAAMRFGHSLMPKAFVPDEGDPWALQFNWFEYKKFVLGKDGKQWMHEISAMTKYACPHQDNAIIAQATNFLFCGENCDNDYGYGEDLGARNIQRGRDHGIPGYNEMRKFCGLEEIYNMDDKPYEISYENWDLLRKVYRYPEEIDAYAGGLSENSSKGGLVGATFNCLIAKQFKKLKDGDRFFFTHGTYGTTKGLRPRTEDSVKKRYLGDIVCQHTRAQSTRKYVMSMDGSYISCRGRDDLNFEEIVDEIVMDFDY